LAEEVRKIGVADAWSGRQKSGSSAPKGGTLGGAADAPSRSACG
jgi:hypothetical protein